MTTYEKNVEKWEKEDVYLDALLLEFRNPIKNRYDIPSNSNIRDLVKKSLNILSPGKIKGELCFRNIRLALEDKVLADKLSEAICERNVMGGRTPMEFYLNMDSNKFESNWFYGLGELYKFNEGQREKAQERVAKYLPSEHTKKINEIGEVIRPIIKGLYDGK